MERLPPFGRAIHEVNMPTSQIYGDLLAKNTNAIKSTHRSTYSYGSHSRQQLDFYPPSPSAPKPVHDEPVPVLIFICGGGFVNGDKVTEKIPEGLVYTNIGYYFAEQHGFETIIPDYRLLKHGAKFPSGGEDVGLVMEWVKRRFEGQKGKRIFLMGNSAGGVHVMTWLLAEQFKESREQFIAGSEGIVLAGVITIGAVYHFPSVSHPVMGIVKGYFGEDYEGKGPSDLLQKAVRRGELKGKWPKTLVLYSELDPQDIIDSNVEFIAVLGKYRKDLKCWSLQGHNHISPPLALGTGIEVEEKWGRDVGAWMKEV